MRMFCNGLQKTCWPTVAGVDSALKIHCACLALTVAVQPSMAPFTFLHASLITCLCCHSADQQDLGSYIGRLHRLDVATVVLLLLRQSKMNDHSLC